MTVADLMRIDKAIDIDAPVERVWRALTNAAELLAWFHVNVEGPIAPGAEVWMTWEQPGHPPQRFRVWFREMTAPARLVWEWHPGSVDATLDYAREPRTIVTFTLEPTRNGTRLSVSETGFDAISLARRAKVYKENSEGWDEVLASLANHAQSTR